MNWDEAKDRPLGYPWRTSELTECFEAVRGGVAFPGKNPGFAVVAGLRRIWSDNIHEVYLLDEVECDDMGELLRQCAGLGYKYQTDRRQEGFEWAGDATNTAASQISWQIAGENQQRRRPGEPVIVASRIVDMGPAAYPYMVSEIRRYATAAHKELYLNESKAELYLQQIQASDMAGLQLGAYPAIEAVGFVVSDLREHARSLLAETAALRDEPAKLDLLGKGRFKERRIFR